MSGPRHVIIPKPEQDRVIKALTERHAVHLAPGEKFDYHGHVSHGEVHLHMQLRSADETDVYLIEGRIDLVENDIQDPNAAKTALLDFLDEVFITYFEGERGARSELSWQGYVHDGVDLSFRSERRNLKLERMADALLEERS